MKRLRVARHEAEAWGDPGKGSEAAAGGGGQEEEQPEVPATGEGGRGTTDAEASKKRSG